MGVSSLALTTLVVMDTNAILMPFETGVRLEPELERLLGSYSVLVPEVVFHELAVIAAEAKGQRRDNAKMALAFANRFQTVRARGRGDSSILQAARDSKAAILTNDKGLQAQSHALGIPVIRLKGQSHLVLETRQGEVR